MPRFMKLLNNISRAQSVYRTEKLKADGICGAHHPFILSICRKPGMTQEEISREICLNKSTVTRALSHLEEKGYVEKRENTSDKRSFLIYPTEKMLELLPKVRSLAASWNSLISKDIPEEELEIFHSVLFRMEEKAKTIANNGEEAFK